MEKNKNVVMFFEIIDFLPMSVANKNYNRYGQKGGWYRIAWAFLKLVDADWRSSRFGQKVRLQMFKPHLKVKEEKLEEFWHSLDLICFKATDRNDEDTNIKDLWNWWRNDKSVEMN